MDGVGVERSCNQIAEHLAQFILLHAVACIAKSTGDHLRIWRNELFRRDALNLSLELGFELLKIMGVQKTLALGQFSDTAKYNIPNVGHGLTDRFGKRIGEIAGGFIGNLDSVENWNEVGEGYVLQDEMTEIEQKAAAYDILTGVSE